MSKKINNFYYLFFLILYLEFFLKIFVTKNLTNFLYTFIFSLFFINLFYLICNIFKEKGNKILTFIITIILWLYYSFQCIFYKLFSNIFSFNTIGLAANIGEFKANIFEAIINHLIPILFFSIPLIFLIIFKNKINFKRTTPSFLIFNLFLCVSFYFISLISLKITKNSQDIYSPYSLYCNVNSEIKTIEKFGLLTYTRLDVKRIIFGFEEKLQTETNEIPTSPEPDEVPRPEPEIITYNELAIDFTSLINNEQNTTIKNTLEYFKNTNPTNKNQYTGMFKDKNLIFLLAEGFNMIAVSPELTPTLYKLTHEGFVFNNFYSPVFLSTTGGEFQATTGLIPNQENLALWKRNKPTISYALGNSFKNLGYHTSSFHDWTYNYYTRQNTMPTLGFDDYLACGNGLEKMMDCTWLPSDIDLINTTFPLYKDYERFATYYVTVSGHAPYSYNSYGNSIALKNIEYVKNLPYTNSLKAYLATQIELDRALEALIKSLDEAGILKDTVISFVGDHYPYTLEIAQINEISSYKRDATIEVNHSNFVIWNSEMSDAIQVDKVGSQIDVLPTLLNLFGIDYDSRLIMGKDILSDEPGLAIFSNRGWVSDYGTYNNGRFTLKEGLSIENEKEYISEINNLVSNRFTMSNNIIKYKIYDYIFK